MMHDGGLLIEIVEFIKDVLDGLRDLCHDLISCIKNE
jgi:hypothetical protein